MFFLVSIIYALIDKKGKRIGEFPLTSVCKVENLLIDADSDPQRIAKKLIPVLNKSFKGGQEKFEKWKSENPDSQANSCEPISHSIIKLL